MLASSARNRSRSAISVACADSNSASSSRADLVSWPSLWSSATNSRWRATCCSPWDTCSSACARCRSHIARSIVNDTTAKATGTPTEAALLVFRVQADLVGFQIRDNEVEQGDCSPIVNANQCLLVARNFGVNLLALLAHAESRSTIRRERGRVSQPPTPSAEPLPVMRVNLAGLAYVPKIKNQPLRPMGASNSAAALPRSTASQPRSARLS